MRAIEAAVEVLKREGIDTAFGLPGAAINPMYAAMKTLGGIDHVLARHVEGASHMAEGYTRTNRGNIGICIGTSSPGAPGVPEGVPHHALRPPRRREWDARPSPFRPRGGLPQAVTP
jgi:tartronate-semialdehyde synthase